MRILEGVSYHVQDTEALLIKLDFISAARHPLSTQCRAHICRSGLLGGASPKRYVAN